MEHKHKEAEAAYAELFDYTFENPPPEIWERVR